MFFNRNMDDTQKVLKRIDGKMIKYVSERDQNNVEEIIGRGGRLVVTDSQVAVNCDGKDVFVCPRETASVSELLSASFQDLSQTSTAPDTTASISPFSFSAIPWAASSVLCS